MFQLLVITLLSVSGIFADVAPGKAPPKLTGKIVGGTTTKIENYPYQISLASSRGSFHFCGGAIVSLDTVVTAAHCLFGKSVADDIQVRIGSSTSGAGGTLLKISKIVIHPNYDPVSYRNDIAIVKLATPVTLSAAVKIIALSSKIPKDSEKVTVSGWGVLHEDAQSAAKNLQVVDLKVVNSADCKNKYQRLNSDIDENLMLCAADDNKDACQGDSGGPLACNGELIGVVSWGIGCARKEAPGIFTKVAKYISWINENINKK